MLILRTDEFPVTVELVESSVPGWLCLEDEWEFERDPVESTWALQLTPISQILASRSSV